GRRHEAATVVADLRARDADAGLQPQTRDHPAADRRRRQALARGDVVLGVGHAPDLAEDGEVRRDHTAEVEREAARRMRSVAAVIAVLGLAADVAAVDA